MKRVALVVADDKVGGIERDSRRRVARAAIGRRLQGARVRRQAAGKQRRESGFHKRFQIALLFPGKLV
jgi:hypothetical protein